MATRLQEKTAIYTCFCHGIQDKYNISPLFFLLESMTLQSHISKHPSCILSQALSAALFLTKPSKTITPHLTWPRVKKKMGTAVFWEHVFFFFLTRIFRYLVFLTHSFTPAKKHIRSPYATNKYNIVCFWRSMFWAPNKLPMFRRRNNNI